MLEESWSQEALAKIRMYSFVSKRLKWRARHYSNKVFRLTIINQFFPPDYAATGQLLHQLAKRIARDNDMHINVLCGQPAYAYEKSDSKAARLEFSDGICIRRTKASKIMPKKLGGRIINSIIFALRIMVRLFRYSRRGDLLLYTTEPAFMPLVAIAIHRLFNTSYAIVVFDKYPDVASKLGIIRKSSVLYRLWEYMAEVSYLNARAVICLSETMKNEIIKSIDAKKGRLTYM